MFIYAHSSMQCMQQIIASKTYIVKCYPVQPNARRVADGEEYSSLSVSGRSDFAELEDRRKQWID